MKRWHVTAAMLLGIAGVMLGTVLSTSASAQTADKYPSKPVKIIVPYGPGGATDIVARILADQLSKSLGQSFFVENKPGAFGIVALEDLARSPADGYTLMIGNVSTNAITPIIYASKMKIDYTKDIVPVTDTVDIPAFVVTTTKNFDVKNLKDLIGYVKKNPGQVRYGTVGNGSYPHYDMAYFAKRAGDLDMVALPNKAGGGGVINDMLAGSAQVAFLNVASTAPQVKAGSLRALALVNHARLPDYPDLPTMQELGFPGVGTIAWQGLFAPGGTPKDVLQTIYKATVSAMKTPEAEARFKQQTFNIVPSASPDEAKKWLAQEMETWRKITSEVKIETE
ncbi:MAG TPA: tripartite tricarboxylate transporter substrate binding protein [Xanthobacteraceae bacterium]|jgi:tripartite-type tricarboxylate transporter receptor subunit TctC|nr:tripartite tricarboxylate transporter substrate binding protein [Xanthobacteraceae bacterium]